MSPIACAKGMADTITANDNQTSVRSIGAMRRIGLLVLLTLGGCGDGVSSPQDGGAQGDGAQGDAVIGSSCPAPVVAGSVCANDPSPCSGSCNSNGYCEMDCGAGPEISIPPGTVAVGSAAQDRRDGLDQNAIPALATITKRFQIDKYKVSRAAYRACVAAKVCSEPSGAAGECNYYQLPRTEAFYPGWTVLENHDHHPVNCTTWIQASKYCAWRGSRLPTEAEWTISGRGPAGCSTYSDAGCNVQPFPWGSERDPRRANVNVDDGIPRDSPAYWRGMTTTPVEFFDGTVRAGGYATGDGSSQHGVMDLLGNVAEWVGDWYEERYQGGIDPVGAVTGTKRVTKGVEYKFPRVLSPFMTLGERVGIRPDVGTEAIGFRCARDIP